MFLRQTLLCPSTNIRYIQVVFGNEIAFKTSQTPIPYRVCYFAFCEVTCNASTLTTSGFSPSPQCHIDVPSTTSSRHFSFKNCRVEQQPGSSTYSLGCLSSNAMLVPAKILTSPLYLLPLTSRSPACHPPHLEGLHPHKLAAWKRWHLLPNVLAPPLIRAAEHFWHWLLAFRPMARCVEWELPLHVAFSTHLSL
jgi:hypothetical protein